MQSRTKARRILAAVSMAAAGTLAARAAHAQTLTMFYGNDPNYANSNNAIIVGNSYFPSFGTKQTTGGLGYFSTGTHVNVPIGTPSNAGGVASAIGSNGLQTITIPVGDYVSLAIDALLTGNVNADGGKSTFTISGGDAVQPSYLGLSQLDINIASSNATGNNLSPITASVLNAAGAPSAGYTGTVFYSTASLNASGLKNVSALGANGGASSASYNVVPSWVSMSTKGGVEPNNALGGWNGAGGAHASPDSGTNASGNVGIGSDPSGGAFAEYAGVNKH